MKRLPRMVEVCSYDGRRQIMKRLPRMVEVFGRYLLREAKCPKCGTDGAYVGLNDVECPNPKCANFKKGVADPAVAKIEEKIKLWGVWSITEGGIPTDGYPNYEELERVFEEIGMKEFPDDPFGAFYDPKSWRLTKTLGDVDNSIYVGHYEEYYFEPLSGAAKSIVKKTKAGAGTASYGRDQFDIPEEVKTLTDMWASNNVDVSTVTPDEWKKFLDSHGYKEDDEG
jgi:hypothetical protein